LGGAEFVIGRLFRTFHRFSHALELGRLGEGLKHAICDIIQPKLQLSHGTIVGEN